MTPNQGLRVRAASTSLWLVSILLTSGACSDTTAGGEPGGGTTASGNDAVASVGASSSGGASSAASSDAATSTSGGDATTGTSTATSTSGATSAGGTGTTVSTSSASNTTSGAGGAASTVGDADSTTADATSGATATTDGGSGGGPQTGCTRETLQTAADSLAQALGAGDATMMALDPQATYVENAQPSDFSQGVWQSAIQIEFQRDFLDVDTCETFSEIIVTAGVPLVLGVRLTLMGSNVSEVTALVTDEDDWAFDAANYAAVSSAEDWSVIPEGERDTRETLIAAGDAYFNLFNDTSVEVPWNTPCTRLEGGQFTTGNTCDVGVPEGITFADKHWIVDRDLGTAIGMVRFGGAGGLPDSHMFRCLQGKIRYVHTITVCDGGC